MKLTLSWLSYYLDYTAHISSIVDTLSFIGIEVEGVCLPQGVTGIIIVEVFSVDQHPNSDKLKVCKVSDGQNIIQVVCGASNVRPGIKTVLASVGSVIPKGLINIQLAKIRGVESNGMLCSYEELGLPDSDSFGIIELSCGNLGEQFFSCEPVIEVNITPNRGDCLGVYGIARDLSAANIGKLKSIPIIDNMKSSDKSLINVVMNTKGIISGRYIEGIENKESPHWLREKLLSIGLKPISFVVDVTNYIMFSYNRPLHVYDADKVSDQLVVEKLDHDIEEFIGLNGKNYCLKKDTTIIFDQQKNVHAVAGVIGSQISACSLDTKNIFLESAWFDPIDVAISSRNIGLSTDASYRFERFVDPEFIENGLNLAVQMIVDYCGGTVYDLVSSEKGVNLAKGEIKFNPNIVNQIGSISVDTNTILDILKSLGFIIKQQSNDYWIVNPPSWRSDIKSYIDIVEEVLRIYGYNNIEEKSVLISNQGIIDNTYDKLRSVLLVRGLYEVLTWSFMDSNVAEKFGYTNKDFLITNPVNSHFNLMRPSILPNLLQLIMDNYQHGQSNMAVFELGPVYCNADVLQGNMYSICGVRFGQNVPRNLYKNNRDVDVFDVKSDIIHVMEVLNIDYNDLSVKECEQKYYHPARSATIYFQDRLIGHFGELHPQMMPLYKLDCQVVCFEIIVPLLSENVRRNQFYDYRYQSVIRDFAFLIDKNVSVGSLVDVVKKSNIQYISNVSVFDIYENQEVENGKVSVAISVVLRSSDHTLSTEEIDQISNDIINTVAKSAGGTLRGV